MSGNEWEQIPGTGYPDQQRDLSDPALYAQIGPEGSARGAWSWTVVEYGTEDEITTGYAASEDAAKQAVANWEAEHARKAATS